jgi:Uma2 family endonuclease
MRKLAPISISDFERIAPMLGPCELINGEIVRMSPGHIPHSVVSANITVVLGNYVRQAKNGRVLANESGVVVKRDLDTVRGADAVYVSNRRLPANTKHTGFLRVPPELVVEVLGEEESWSEIEQKVAEYHGIGVDMVWVADPKTLSVRLYPKKGEPYVLQTKDEIAGGKLLPGFKCKVSEFFAGI